MKEQKSLFEKELKEEEEKKKKAPRGKRSLKLIADFVDGFAKDWFFCVSEAFKNELDIKLTERKEPATDNRGNIVYIESRDKEDKIILNKDGSPKMKKKTKSVLKWTQGKYFCFDRGHVLYDTPKAYDDLWSEALKHIKLRCQILRAIPNKSGRENKIIPGNVTFKLSKPNKDKTELVDEGQYSLTQDEFVEFLKTGKMKGVPILQNGNGNH